MEGHGVSGEASASSQTTMVDGGIAALVGKQRLAHVEGLPIAEVDSISPLDLCRMLSGPYLLEGFNHGRPFFMKEDSAYERGMLRVFLFYWDDRDGPEFKGWWFADRVGGVDVWARSSCDSVLPPSSGWRCPWDLEAPNEVIFPRVVFPESDSMCYIMVNPGELD